MIEEKDASTTRACRVVNLPRSMWYYTSVKDDTELEAKLQELAEQLPHRGIDSYYGRLKAQGYPWGRKRVLRVYRKLNLQHRRKRKRRIPKGEMAPLTLPISQNIIWSMDFMHDVLDSGRKFRVLNVIDDFNREALAVEAEFSYPSVRVINVLDRLVEFNGKPSVIRVDNGTEFTSDVFKQWCKTNHIKIQYTQPGKPMQNAYIERFNRTFREDILDAYLFEDIQQVRELSEAWRNDYNNYHPHKSLLGMSPKQFKNRKMNYG